MWNPYPTKSKPVTIWKKHTNQPRTKARQRQENTRVRRNTEKLRILKKYKERVSDYWKWRIEDFPNPPKFTKLWIKINLRKK